MPTRLSKNVSNILCLDWAVCLGIVKFKLNILKLFSQVASAQTLSPVLAGVNVSPYRIVRIVDREGQITGLRQNSETTLECTRQV